MNALDPLTERGIAVLIAKAIEEGGYCTTKKHEQLAASYLSRRALLFFHLGYELTLENYQEFMRRWDKDVRRIVGMLS